MFVAHFGSRPRSFFDLVLRALRGLGTSGVEGCSGTGFEKIEQFSPSDRRPDVNYEA